MRTCRPSVSCDRRGVVFITALVLVTVAASLGVVICWTSMSNLQQAHNHSKSQRAAMQAESGLAYLSYLLRQVSLPPPATGQAILDLTAQHLSDCLDQGAAMGGATVSYDGTTISVPEIRKDDSQDCFSAELWMAEPKVLRVWVLGRAGDVYRKVQIDCDAAGGHPVFGFGISSKGPICFENTVEVRGKNEPSEARLLSMSSGLAFRLLDSLTLDGDIYAPDGNATVNINGTGTIAGVPMWDPNVSDHVHIGEGFPSFPEIDTAVFEGFATAIVDSSVETNGIKNFKNIRIKAGTNPTFMGTINIQGVVFIEQPNKVTFGAGTTITGVVCTEAATPGPDNVIKFEEGTYSYGVQELPDINPFREIRELTGSFILAPGFRVRFENESGAINGIVAAEHVKFENIFNGTLCGGIICYGEDEIVAENLSSFTIDKSSLHEVPAGFEVEERRLAPNANSYVEP
jgi:hypothetical protein